MHQLPDKQGNDGAGKQLIADNADTGESHAPEAGAVRRGLHALVVFGGIVVSDQGHHALTQTHAYVHGQHVNLLDDAEGGHGNIAVCGGLGVHQQDAEAGEKCVQRGGESHGENLLCVAGAGQEQPERQGEDGFSPQAGEHEEEIDQSADIGKKGGNCCAGDLQTGIQQNKHEQGIQKNVQNAAHAEAETGLFGITFTAEQVGQSHAEDGGQSAQHNDKKGIG